MENNRNKEWCKKMDENIIKCEHSLYALDTLK